MNAKLEQYMITVITVNNITVACGIYIKLIINIFIIIKIRMSEHFKRQRQNSPALYVFRVAYIINVIASA